MKTYVIARRLFLALWVFFSAILLCIMLHFAHVAYLLNTSFSVCTPFGEGPIEIVIISIIAILGLWEFVDTVRQAIHKIKEREV